MNLYKLTNLNSFDLWFGNLHVYGFSFDGIVTHHFDYVLCIFGRDVHKGEVVKDVDSSDAFSWNTGLTCDGPDDVVWSYAVFLSDIEEKTLHTRFTHAFVTWCPV